MGGQERFRSEAAEIRGHLQATLTLYLCSVAGEIISCWCDSYYVLHAGGV